MKPSELLVILQLDEIHIKPKLIYKCGKLIGNAGNNAQHQANRIQCFMVSYVLSSNRDVVSLVQNYSIGGGGTSQFISIVLKFWNIVNVKNTTKGLHKLLEDATIISSIKDDRLKWLDRFSSWLKLWNTKTEKQ